MIRIMLKFLVLNYDKNNLSPGENSNTAMHRFALPPQMIWWAKVSIHCLWFSEQVINKAGQWTVEPCQVLQTCCSGGSSRAAQTIPASLTNNGLFLGGKDVLATTDATSGRIPRR